MKTNDAKHYWQSPYIDWVSAIPRGWDGLILYVRAARIKARVAAVIEALSLLWDLDAKALIGGPLAEEAGVFWLILPPDRLKTALSRLPHLGYVEAVDLLRPSESEDNRNGDPKPSTQRTVRWRRQDYSLVRLYTEDPRALRSIAPDKRVFLLETSEGEVRPIRGYRGGGAPLNRRGLPVVDSRMLVNLASRGTGKLLLDPFAGVGGIILEAVSSGFVAVSSDIDPALRYGLSRYSAFHSVSDARALPYSTATFDAIATELPFHEVTAAAVTDAFHEMDRVLKEGGRLVVMSARWQSKILLQQAKKLDLILYLDSPINRKGLDTGVLAWQKVAKETSDELE